MKKFLFSALFIFCTLIISAQTTYLVNVLKPVDSHNCTIYKYVGNSSRPIDILGGGKWFGGFTIGQGRSLIADENLGHTTFNLGGKWSKLMFAYGPTENNEKVSIVAIYADGKKIFDQIVRQFSLPERVTLDVTGVNELKFAIVKEPMEVGFAEVTLWNVGQNPMLTGGKKPSTIQTRTLVQEIEPYLITQRIKPVSPTSEIKSLKISGREYNSGLQLEYTTAIVGEYQGDAYFDIEKQYSKLQFVVGPIDENGGGVEGSGWLTIKADNKIIHELEIHEKDLAKIVTIDISGYRSLSFHSNVSEWNMVVGLADITVYPEGTLPAESATVSNATADPKLAVLPNVCKLISNIAPYSTAGSLAKENMIYDGRSDYVTFSMGGIKYSEGIILTSSSNILQDNVFSSASFDLGNQFDNITFTTGYVGKSWVMKDDILEVYADDKLIYSAPMSSTQGNQQHSVKINKCRKLQFQNRGEGGIAGPAYGVADIVLYRGEPVANELFVHPIPDCPETIDLIDLSKPYIHYVSSMSDYKDEMLYDGSTIRKYFDLNGKHINKGFLLKTSVHFSLEHGVLGNQGTAGAIVGGAAVGSAFVAGSVAVGGAVVGFTLIGAAAFLALAAGGEAWENSCAAFNTYGAYNSVTFTVACLKPVNSGIIQDKKETLLIGADQIVMAEIAVSEDMEPTTVTVPIYACKQLMFWLVCSGNTSGQYVFYDIVLDKKEKTKSVPKTARLSNAVISQPLCTEKQLTTVFERPKSSGVSDVDSYLSGCSNIYSKTVEIIEKATPSYEYNTWYLETSSGKICKAVALKSFNSDDYKSIAAIKSSNLYIIKDIQAQLDQLISLGISKASAFLALPDLGLDAIAYKKIMNDGGKAIKECRTILKVILAEKTAENDEIEWLMNNALRVDGIASDDTTIICPLKEGEVPPTKELQLVNKFNFPKR